MIEYSHRYIFFNPAHDPRKRMDRELVLETALRRELQSPSENWISYEPLPEEFSIERRWLEKHIWDEPKLKSQELPHENNYDPLKHTDSLSKKISTTQK